MNNWSHKMFPWQNMLRTMLFLWAGISLGYDGLSYMVSSSYCMWIQPVTLGYCNQAGLLDTLMTWGIPITPRVKPKVIIDAPQSSPNSEETCLSAIMTMGYIFQFLYMKYDFLMWNLLGFRDLVNFKRSKPIMHTIAQIGESTWE